MVITLYQPHSFCQLGTRQNQEDCRLPDNDSPSDSQFFYAVCDGVGGAADGEVASHSVCQSLHEALCDTDWGKPFTTDDFQQALTMVYDNLDTMARQTGNYDMATTLAFVCFHGSGFLAAHIGDSRVYQIRPDTGIVYRSSDHSQANSLVHAGVVSPDAGGDSSVITRYLEPTSDDQPRCLATVLQSDDIRADDYFLLCSDGVTACIDDDTLTAIISLGSNDAEKCSKIASLCRQSSDNNTAYLIHVADVTLNDSATGQSPETDGDGDDYTEHVTKRSQRPLPQSVDVEADAPEVPLTTSIFNFIRNIFN